MMENNIILAVAKRPTRWDSFWARCTYELLSFLDLGVSTVITEMLSLFLFDEPDFSTTWQLKDDVYTNALHVFF